MGRLNDVLIDEGVIDELVQGPQIPNVQTRGQRPGGSHDQLGGGGDESVAESFFQAGRLSEFPNGPIVCVLGFFHLEPPDGITIRISPLSY